MDASKDQLAPKPSMSGGAIRDALRDQGSAVGDLRVVECALKAAADENDPLDWETRLIVLDHAACLLHDRLETIDEAIDSIEEELLAKNL